jgi:hypothetical protein
MSTIGAVGTHHHHHGVHQASQASSSSSSTKAAAGTLTAPADALQPGSSLQTQSTQNGLMKVIEQAVTSALQSAPSNADPNQVVQQAIEDALKNPNSASDPNGDGDSDSKTQATFAQTLQSFGITPKQFQSDLAAAVQSTQGGNTSSFPPGMFLDTIA